MMDAYVVETPVWRWQEREIDALVGEGSEIFIKLELLQRTGTFKARGAVNNLLRLDEEARRRGVTAVSAGNHAIAVAWAAGLMGSTARLVMPQSAPPGRVQKVRDYGGDVVLVDNVHAAFDEVRRIEREEGRTFVHPFEGKQTILGTATVGMEFCQQAADLDVVIIPIGGGGLAAGMATAIKQMQPHCQIYGVEPEGANTMWLSFQAGSPQAIDKVSTIADSLGAPTAARYSFALCHHFIEEIVLVSDDALKESMRLLFRSLKLVCEPACAAAAAAMIGPLRQKILGKRVGIIACGSNIDVATYCRIMSDE
ncbi:MAG: threonine/serine dehydratase [Caldilineaceae bacterium]|nr:threonine/serine dehydratase [Caldilineaceae bacterium]